MSVVFNKVKEILVEALAIDENDIVENASLYADLGAESIDLLDMVFRLEREFNIRISSDELFPTGIFRGEDGYILPGGELTEKGLSKLKEAVPYGDFSKLGSTPRQENIPNLFTVNTLVKFIENKMAESVV